MDNEGNRLRQRRRHSSSSVCKRLCFHFGQMMTFSSVLGLLYLIGAVLIYFLIDLLWELDLSGKHVTFTHQKVEYTGAVFMTISVMGMVYCLLRGDDTCLVKRCIGLGSNWYLMIGVYTFGTGTLFRTVQFLVSYAYCKEESSTIVYYVFHLLFTVTQILFIQQFSTAAFRRTSLFIILIYHIMATNTCLFLTSVIRETDIFSHASNVKHEKCMNTSDVSKTAAVWDAYTTAFTVEFSLIAIGILASIKNQTYFFLPSRQTEESNAERHGAKKSLLSLVQAISSHSNGRTLRVSALKPLFLMGLTCSVILLVSALSISQNKEIKAKIWGLIFYHLVTLTIFVFQSLSLWKLLEGFRHYRWAWHPLKSDDYLLIITGFGSIGLTILNLVAESDSLPDTKLANPSSPILFISYVVHSILTLFQATVLIRVRRYEFRREFTAVLRNHETEKYLMESLLFLMITNAGFWAAFSFFEIKSSDFYPDMTTLYEHYWQIIVGILYPFAIFYRFHSAIMLLDTWQMFHAHRIEERDNISNGRRTSIP